MDAIQIISAAVAGGAMVISALMYRHNTSKAEKDELDVMKDDINDLRTDVEVLKVHCDKDNDVLEEISEKLDEIKGELK